MLSLIKPERRNRKPHQLLAMQLTANGTQDQKTFFDRYVTRQ